MNDNFEKWQQQYHQNTPSVDVGKLAKQVAKLQSKERLKAWSELVFGLVISVFCVVSALYFAQSATEKVIYLCLSPAPVGFALWAFSLTKKRWRQASYSTRELLDIKRQHEIDKVRYWRMSALVVSALWLVLLCTSVVMFVLTGSLQPWLGLTAINAIVVTITLYRYLQLQKALTARLQDIESLT
ncbi:hypothetical protein ACFO4O_00915 [Glaciecola siphonariae]|uniref:Uncharacterized protein n=1 Tax=Glaciecola siphonariae TaxID=521012 RepID=A0ABV9LSB9_9ALTE